MVQNGIRYIFDFDDLKDLPVNESVKCKFLRITTENCGISFLGKITIVSKCVNTNYIMFEVIQNEINSTIISIFNTPHTRLEIVY